MPAAEIMRKFYAGTLKSGSGAKVTNVQQAKAIAASYERKEHKKKNSNRHPHLAPDGSVKMSHSMVRGCSR